MEIRRDSWHFKVYEFSYGPMGFSPGSTNLCKYFWRVAWGLFIGVSFVSLASLLVYGVGYLFWNFPAFSFAGVGAGGLALWASIRYERARKARLLANGRRKPGPGLLRSYLKAKKDKVCPLVTFVNAP